MSTQAGDLPNAPCIRAAVIVEVDEIGLKDVIDPGIGIAAEVLIREIKIAVRQDGVVPNDVVRGAEFDRDAEDIERDGIMLD